MKLTERLLHVSFCSLPSTVLEWTVQNDGDEELNVSIVFTFKNGWGDPKRDSKLKPETGDIQGENFVGRKIRQDFDCDLVSQADCIE